MYYQSRVNKVDKTVKKQREPENRGNRQKIQNLKEEGTNKHDRR
jgi:hypothetical protein